MCPMSAPAAVQSEPPVSSEPLDVSFESDALSALVRNFEIHGDAFRMFSPALQRDLWVLSNPDHVRHVLVDRGANFTKGVGIDRVAILLGNGLMTSEGEQWRAQRKLIQPSFHRNVIATRMPHLHTANATLAAKWGAAAAEGAAVNLTQDMSEVTLEVVLRALFGDDLAQLTTGSGGNPFALLTDETERNLAFAYKFRQLGKLILEEVQRRRRDGVRHNDILSHLIDARDRQTAAPMEDRQLLDEIMTLIVAGHETTASSLNWFWYLLTQAPHVAARLHAEVDAAFADPPGYKDLEQLPYVRRAIDETLRLYPPGWLLTRRSIAPDRIGGYALPAKTDVLISPYLVQRHPEHWPDPGRFDPDRFLPKNSAGRNRFAYLPFGLGPRACIGEHLALVEMHTHVATLARRFDLQLVAGQTIELEGQVNLRMRHPLRMIPRVRT
jgi:cytochrome P450